jgi:hypothetical protein
LVTPADAHAEDARVLVGQIAADLGREPRVRLRREVGFEEEVRSLYVDADLRVGVGSQLQWRRMFVGIIDVLLDLELVPPALHHATQSCDVDTQRDAYLNFWLVMRTGAAGT